MPIENLKIGILATGKLPTALSDVHGEYPSLYMAWLAPLNAEFSSYSLLDGDLPNSPNDCDVWLITGSKFGAYDDHAWIPPLEQFIRNCKKAGKKMIGICFGHQIIAQALGGQVEKSDKGWGLGVHEYDWINWPAKFGKQPQTLKLQAVHQDQIIVLPADAINIGRSDFCAHAAFWYPDFALTVQGHPEFSNQFADDLLEERKGTAFSETDVERAKQTVWNETNQSELAQFIRDNISTI